MMTYGDHWTSLRRSVDTDEAAMRIELARYSSVPSSEFIELDAFMAELRSDPDPTELPDDEIIPDETRPLEDEPVKTDQVPEE